MIYKRPKQKTLEKLKAFLEKQKIKIESNGIRPDQKE